MQSRRRRGRSEDVKIRRCSRDAPPHTPLGEEDIIEENSLKNLQIPPWEKLEKEDR